MRNDVTVPENSSYDDCCRSNYHYWRYYGAYHYWTDDTDNLVVVMSIMVMMGRGDSRCKT